MDELQMDVDGFAGASRGIDRLDQDLDPPVSDSRLEKMFQRREMELRDELEQIKSLGKVYSLKGQLDRRLGRNLALKQSTGPLGKKGGRLSRSSSMKRRRLRKQSFRKWHKSVAIGHDALESHGSGKMSSLYQKQMTDQEQELKDIEELSLVGKHSTRDAISHHLKSHASRLTNRRLMILDSSKNEGRQTVYKKSSVLVTSVEDDEELVRELHRQQSRAFIESIIQCPSRQQRVLEKLSTEQRRKISDAELMKKSWTKNEDKEKEEVGIRRSFSSPTTPADFQEKDVAAIFDSFDMAKEVHSPTSKELASSSISPDVPALAPSEFIVADSCAPRKETANSINDASEAEDDDDDDDDDDAEYDYVSLKSSGQDELGAVGGECFSLETRAGSMAMLKGEVHTSRVEMDVSYSLEDGRNALLTTTLESSQLAVEAQLMEDSINTLPLEEAETLSWAESSQESSEMSQASHFHGSHSSPQFPLSMPGATPTLISSLSGCATNSAAVHGTYSKMDVEFNPFASEFKLGARPEDSVSNVPKFTSVKRLSSRPGSASRKLKLPSSRFSPISHFSPQTSEKTAIPRKAFQDKGFLQFMEELGHDPEVSDYITYKVRVIGDQIEKKYYRELNQAMDEVFYELVKQSLSWRTFKAVSKRLLVCGARVQDSILLVPCFARRLVDMVPQLGGRIADYTEQVLDSYASDSILGMGGWNSFMEGYREFEAPDVEYGTAVDPVCTEVRSPGAAGPYATLPTRKKSASPRSHSLDVPVPPEEISVTQSLSHYSTSRSPSLCLRRSNSVEVLFPEEECRESNNDEDLQSSTHPRVFSQSLMSRSISVNSLDLASPSCVNPRLASVSLTRSDSRSSVVISTRFGLSPLPEEDHRTMSRRSSVCSSIMLTGLNAADSEVVVTDSGFEIIGRTSKLEDRKDSDESGAQSGSWQSNSASPGRMDSSGSSASESESGQRRRRRSSAEVLAPLFAVATHAVAFTCYYMSL